ncbi:MAG: 5-formyltetrahydrofolate cyclo-ligase [Pseudomonadota bacterium]|nr:5-formyltetrahydrofolate cyclo-ligase [Pseudomonadota bacterium]
MEQEKLTLRKSCLKSRILVKNKKFKEKRIIKNIECLINQNDLPISAYFPVKSEVNLLPLMKSFQKKERKICLPIIITDNSYLLFREWKLNCKLVTEKYKIRVPINSNLLEPRILLIPLLGFDSERNRLGYGGGYFDRTISFLEKKNKILKIGVAFDEQERKKIPTTKFDKKMDTIITQSRIIT